MNVFGVFIIICVLFGLNSPDVKAWRRRRRTTKKIHKRSTSLIKKNSIPVPTHEALCTMHGEYAIKNGKLLPVDKQGQEIKGLKCNKNLCWKGDYCWQCQLSNGKNKFQAITQNMMKDLICKDVQCLVGKTDAGSEYYSTNNSRSLPLAKGPFSCNNFLCMSGNKCWKCRLNSDETDFEVIHKGKEFNSKVTCCPLSKRLASVENSGGGNYEAKTSHENVVSTDDDEESLQLVKKNSISIDLKKKKLITGIEIYHKKKSRIVLFVVSYSQDGKSWNDYKEYGRTAVFRSSRIAEKKHRTLFKPLVGRYAKIRPYFATKNFKITVNLHGCDMLVS
eukprot:Seg1528.5 transcript_id=Seg1528.5/GoldUCD/mRNA.D3Y31 product="Coagulation factor VIII" protein_id=Seg1528.5/GoldUCD/D3Y31